MVRSLFEHKNEKVSFNCNTINQTAATNGMNKLTEKPHLLFFLSIPLVILIGFLSGDEVVDINIHDTYFLIERLDLALMLALFVGIMGIGYWILYKTQGKLLKWSYWTQVGITFGGAFVVWVLTKCYRPEYMEYEFNNKLTLLISLLVILMGIAQLLFPLNILYGILKKKSDL